MKDVPGGITRKFVNLRSYGGRYARNGVFYRGWITLIDEDGGTLYCADGPWLAACDYADALGHDTMEVRAVIARWTGELE